MKKKQVKTELDKIVQGSKVMSYMSYLASQSEDGKKKRARLGERSKQSVVQSW